MVYRYIKYHPFYLPLQQTNTIKLPQIYVGDLYNKMFCRKLMSMDCVYIEN